MVEGSDREVGKKTHAEGKSRKEDGQAVEIRTRWKSDKDCNEPGRTGEQKSNPIAWYSCMLGVWKNVANTAGR